MTETRELILDDLRITAAADTASASVAVTFGDQTRRLDFAVGGQYSSMLSDRYDAALVGLLMYAIAVGADIVINGEATAELVRACRGPIQSILLARWPGLRVVDIRCVSPAGSRPADEGAFGATTGFSGGIDSWSVVDDYFLRPDVSEVERLTHLLFNDVGGHGPGGEELFESRRRQAESSARALGLPLVSIVSNLADFYDDGRADVLGDRWQARFQQTHTLRNAAAVLALAQGFRRFYYASGYSYSSVTAGPSSDIAYVDPILIPWLSTGQLSLAAVGGQYTRPEKTDRISQWPVVFDKLDVCFQVTPYEVNCSRCSKCLRTLAALEMLGRTADFSSSFDLDEWSRQRDYYMKRVALHDDYWSRELRVFSAQVGYALPISSRRARLERSFNAHFGWSRRLVRSLRSRAARVKRAVRN